jgi:predicted metal-binding protein
MKRKATKASAKKVKLSNTQLCEAAKRKGGVIEACIIPPSQVETAEWVRLKCQFGCGGFGQCLVCRAVLLHCEPEADVKAIVAELERDIFLAGYWKAFGLGAGPCYFCRSCPVDEQECRYPERARPSMEACGIDVFSTVKKFGFPIEVVRTTRQCPNYYGLLLVD